MTQWSLSEVLGGLHDEIERRLATARKTLVHAGTKGMASEHVWLDLLQTYLPKRYQAATAHVVDSRGQFSDQMDVVVFDRQYSPFLFQFEGQTIVPAESVYAVFEAKQTINGQQLNYAQKKVSTVRRLHRTSLPIPSAGGLLPAKALPHILGGLLALESGWDPPLPAFALEGLRRAEPEERLDLGCIAAHGIFLRHGDEYSVTPQGKAATAFLFELIARLQASATVPMIDIREYGKWLRKNAGE
jgi:hypothetical protein